MSNDSTGRRGRFPPLAVNAVSAGWGFAEATFFFIVPDVLLTWFALSCTRKASWACLWTVIGALLGGTLMYSWAAHNATSAEDFLVRIPAINAEMVEKVGDQVEQGGTKSLFLGPFSGRPYKIYAVAAGDQDQGWISFLLISIPARLIRFLLLSWLVGWLCQCLFTRMPLRTKRLIHLACWLTFYSWHFMATG
jgi:membrane protein YqaA with SNARE-associated domain